MTATLDQPVKAPAFQKLSLRRKVADNVATVLVTLPEVAVTDAVSSSS